jgi:integrase
MNGKRTAKPWGFVYRRKSRGKFTRFLWLKYQFPGEPYRRQATNPRTEDEVEAQEQLYRILGERGYERRERRAIEDATVDDFLDRYLLHCAKHGRRAQVGRVEAWRTALGPWPVTEVTYGTLDDLCQGWLERGPTWRAGSRTLPNGTTVTWPARDAARMRPLSGASVNRLVSVLRKAYKLGARHYHWRSPLEFPHFDEGERGTYITEDQCCAICANFQARFGCEVKADVFRLAYLTGIRKGRLRNARKRHVLILGDTWKLRWPKEETKGKKRPHVVVLGEEERAIVQRAWANRRPDCDFLFHVDGKPLGPMRYELQRTCALLGIPYGRHTEGGVVFHDTRHSAVTNLGASGTDEAAARSITGHEDAGIYQRYGVRRDDVQADATARRDEYLARQRGEGHALPAVPRLPVGKGKAT